MQNEEVIFTKEKTVVLRDVFLLVIMIIVELSINLFMQEHFLSLKKRCRSFIR